MEFRELGYSKSTDFSRHVEEPDDSADKLMIQSIDVAGAIAKMDEGWSPFILDVRSEHEYSISRIDGVDLRVTHDEVLSAIDQIPADCDVLVHCAAGVRSEMAIMLLMEAGRDGSLLYNLSGGMNSWQRLLPAKTIRG